MSAASILMHAAANVRPPDADKRCCHRASVEATKKRHRLHSLRPPHLYRAAPAHQLPHHRRSERALRSQRLATAGGAAVSLHASRFAGCARSSRMRNRGGGRAAAARAAVRGGAPRPRLQRSRHSAVAAQHPDTLAVRPCSRARGARSHRRAATAAVGTAGSRARHRRSRTHLRAACRRPPTAPSHSTLRPQASRLMCLRNNEGYCSSSSSSRRARRMSRRRLPRPLTPPQPHRGLRPPLPLSPRLSRT